MAVYVRVQQDLVLETLPSYEGTLDVGGRVVNRRRQVRARGVCRS